MLPQLRRLEQTYPDHVTVVGVHAAKFPAEQDTANVRAACLALGVEHAVVNDPDHVLWDGYAVSAWPTLVFVDPHGRVIGQHAGELRFPELGTVVEMMLHQMRDADMFSEEAEEAPLPLRREPLPDGVLAFPDTVLPDLAHGRLLISDTGRHRLLITDPNGAVRRVIGRGVASFSNGNGQAGFNLPRGLALAPDGNALYVADSDNHAIRRVDLIAGTVTTVAGTGSQAERFHRGGPAREVALSSPWDLALSPDGGTLFIAMAGFHQLWALDIASGMIGPYSGTGHEGIKDDVRARAWHAQPSGLSLDVGGNGDGARLYVADSETSAVRAVDTRGPGGGVRTLVGEGLFVFGDRDGPGQTARLQHPLGVCAVGDTVYVADSYNNRIRQIDIISGEVRSVAGDGTHGFQDGVGESARLWEPSSIRASDDGSGALYIADTNNHAVRVLDRGSGELTTLRVIE